MHTRLLRALAGAFVLSATLSIQTLAASCPHTPRPGTRQRAAIMNALRQPVMAELGQRVVFVVRTLRLCDGWALMDARPVRPGGGKVDYSHTRYAEAIREGVFDEGVLALLRKGPRGWKVLEYVIGATDYPGGYWVRRHHAPPAILP